MGERLILFSLFNLHYTIASYLKLSWPWHVNKARKRQTSKETEPITTTNRETLTNVSLRFVFAGYSGTCYIIMCEWCLKWIIFGGSCNTRPYIYVIPHTYEIYAQFMQICDNNNTVNILTSKKMFIGLYNMQTWIFQSYSYLYTHTNTCMHIHAHLHGHTRTLACTYTHKCVHNISPAYMR